MASPRFTLRQLEIFLAVARTGSITGAADILHLSPSATSAAVTELERAMGSTLCVRRKARGVNLTAAGRLLEQRSLRLLAEAADIKDVLAEAESGDIHGSLRLGCYSPLSASFLPHLMQHFSSSFPAVDIELVERSEDHLHEMMLDGHLDISLGYERPTHPDLHSLHMASRRPHVIVSGDHRLASSDEVELAELAEEPLILLDVVPSKRTILTWFDAAGIFPQIRWVTHDVDLTRSLVGRGLGYAVLMQRQQHNSSIDGYRIRSLEIRPVIDPVDVYLITTHAALQTRRVRVFTEFARSTQSTFPAWSGVTKVE